MRAYSPAVKAYYHQWDSLTLNNGEIYRFIESDVEGQVPSYQLLLPHALRQTFLDLVHCGLAGHLGAFKTRTHVRRRVCIGLSGGRTLICTAGIVYDVASTTKGNLRLNKAGCTP